MGDIGGFDVGRLTTLKAEILSFSRLSTFSPGRDEKLAISSAHLDDTADCIGGEGALGEGSLSGDRAVQLLI